VEAERAKVIGNKVQDSKAESLEGREDERCPQPNAQGHGKLQRAAVNRITQARDAGGVGDEGHSITITGNARRPLHGRCQTVSFGNGRQLNLLEVYITHCDQRWLSTQ
jgi:hypothetical protein